MVNTSEGRPPQHQTQMKLFNAIAATAFVGASLFLIEPVNARSPWDYFGRAGGVRHYAKLVSRRGSTIVWDNLTLTDAGKSKYSYWLGDCNRWSVDVQVEKSAKFFEPTAVIPPGTTIDKIMTRYCL